MQCYFCGIVETGKCESNTSQDKLKVPTEHALEGCVWWPVLPLASLVEPVQVCEWDQSCFYKEIICEIVYKNISIKSQGVKCRCTYGVTLPGEYLQVSRWWQGRCLSVRCSATWSGLQASTPTPTRVSYRLNRGSFTIPKKETVEVYSHIGTHATPAVGSPRLKIVTVTYEFSEASSDTLPLIAVYVTCPPRSAPSTTTGS